MPFETLTRASALTEAHVAEACESSEMMENLLVRFAEVAAPGDGAERIFQILARLAFSCDWLEGDARIEIWGSAPKVTSVSCLIAIGGGFREKLFGDVRLAIAFEDLLAALRANPGLATPLVVKDQGRRLVLTATSDARTTSMPPPLVGVDASCLYEAPVPAAPRTALGTGRKATLPLAGGAPSPREPSVAARLPRPPEGARLVVRKRVRPVGGSGGPGGSSDP